MFERKNMGKAMKIIENGRFAARFAGAAHLPLAEALMAPGSWQKDLEAVDREALTGTALVKSGISYI